jgi:hypothetical protein
MQMASESYHEWFCTLGWNEKIFFSISICNSDKKLPFAIIKSIVKFEHDWSKVRGAAKD